MAGSELVIDEEFCKNMGKYFESRGNHLDASIQEYIQILENIKNNSITSGEVSEALESYVQYSRKMQNKIKPISESAKRQIDKFLQDVDAADQYVF